MADLVKAIAFLRSVIASGESLSDADNEWLDKILANDESTRRLYASYWPALRKEMLEEAMDRRYCPDCGTEFVEIVVLIDLAT
jgi:hypothetical protein